MEERCQEVATKKERARHAQLWRRVWSTKRKTSKASATLEESLLSKAQGRGMVWFEVRYEMEDRRL